MAGKNKSKDYIKIASLRRFLKNQDAFLVSNDAVVFLKDHLEQIVSQVTGEAMKLVSADKRKKLTRVDIQQVTR